MDALDGLSPGKLALQLHLAQKIAKAILIAYQERLRFAMLKCIFNYPNELQESSSDVIPMVNSYSDRCSVFAVVVIVMFCFLVLCLFLSLANSFIKPLIMTAWLILIAEIN